jgi:uncharacterized membrane protein YuzA (DUF378 family)
MTQSSDAQLAQRQQVFWMIYGALLMCIGMYGFIAYSVFAKQTGAGTLSPAMLYALVGVALVEMLIVIPLMRGKLLPPRKEATSLDEPALSDGNFSAAIGQLYVAQIVTWALCESIALFGLVLVVVSHDPRYFLGFAVVAVANFILYRPSVELMRSVARAAAASQS